MTYLQKVRSFPGNQLHSIQQLRRAYEPLPKPHYDRLRPAQLLFLFALLTGGVTFGQITSPQADAVRSVSYTTAEGEDPLFVFYQSDDNNPSGSLTATGPTTGNFDFDWTEYDPDTDGFTISRESETGESTSTVTGLTDGGYRVQVSNGTDIDTSFTAWVMLNNLLVYTEKDENGELESFRSGCSDGNFIVIAGGVEIDSFYYYDPVSHERILYPNDFDIRWTSDNPDLTIYNPTNKEAMGANYSNAPPYKDTYYFLSATDSTGMTEVDTVFYDTKHTKAEFTVKYEDKVTLEWEDELGTGFDKEKGSMDAPLSVRFFNESLNGYEFTWVYLDTTNEETGLSTKEFDINGRCKFRAGIYLPNCQQILLSLPGLRERCRLYRHLSTGGRYQGGTLPIGHSECVYSQRRRCK